jgi:hypothetical protein
LKCFKRAQISRAAQFSRRPRSSLPRKSSLLNDFQALDLARLLQWSECSYWREGFTGARRGDADMHSIVSIAATTMNENDEGGYRVEVSGWDANETFFVEKSRLMWSEKQGKRLALRALVRIGAVLFVRLIQPLGGGSGFPVAYRAVEFGSGKTGEHGMVTLEQLQPRLALMETIPNFTGLEPRLLA